MRNEHENSMTEIETSRLRMRRFTQDDFDEHYAKIASDALM